MRNIAGLVSDLLICYPSLTAEESDSGFVLKGIMRLDAVYENRDHLVQDFPLRVIVAFDFPVSPPTVFVEDESLLVNYEHLMRDGSLCLGAPGEIALALQNEPSLVWFFKNVVMGNLYAVEYSRIYGCLPAGERSHGSSGIVEAYCEMFELGDFWAVMRLLQCIHDKSYRGHLACPCGSGLRGRDCHGSLVLEIMNGSSWQAISGDFEFVLKDFQQIRTLAAEKDKKKAALHALTRESIAEFLL